MKKSAEVAKGVLSVPVGLLEREVNVGRVGSTRGSVACIYKVRILAKEAHFGARTALCSASSTTSASPTSCAPCPFNDDLRLVVSLGIKFSFKKLPDSFVERGSGVLRVD